MAAKPHCISPQTKPTVGVSYLVPSASQQFGAQGSPPALPHLVIRPPNLVPATGPCVAQMLAVINEEAVAAVILPLRDDPSIKQFLLDPSARRSILVSLSGCVMTIGGARALAPILTDRTMVCLMYSWTPKKGLQACASSAEALPGSGRPWWESNVQVGVAIAAAASLTGHPRLKLYTLSCRLEMYVAEDTWLGCSREAKTTFAGAMCGLERFLAAETSSHSQNALAGLEGPNGMQAAMTDTPASGESEIASIVVEEDAGTERDPARELAEAAGAALAAEPSERAAAGPFPWPLYLIGTRDCFTNHLVPISEQVMMNGRLTIKTTYFFRPGEAPENYQHVVRALQEALSSPGPGEHIPAKCPGTELLPVGITTYTGMFSEAALAEMEGGADKVDAKARAGRLPPECWHATVGRGGQPKRTKFFFGARYLWTREQLASVAASRARGVRADVPGPPSWIQEHIEQALVRANLVQPGFFNSWALNMYHDGSEGIQSHYDDPDRFEQPIYSLRLFSDSRLSFGTQLYGYTNGAFCIDMPRGCVTVMERGGYAANGIKHCVRPVDMTGKSAGLILRRMNAAALVEARRMLVEQVAHALASLSLTHSMPALADPGSSASRNTKEESLERDVRKVLDGCIRSLEPKRGRGRARSTDDGPVLKVMDRMLLKVERQVAKGQRQARDVADVLDRMVVRVHAGEEAERQHIRQVMTKMLDRVEMRASPARAMPISRGFGEANTNLKRMRTYPADPAKPVKRPRAQHHPLSPWGPPTHAAAPAHHPSPAGPQHLAALLAGLPDAPSAYVYHQPHLPVTGAASQSFQELLLSPDEPLKDSGLIVPPSTAQPDYSWATSSTGPGHFCQEAVGVKAEDAATGAAAATSPDVVGWWLNRAVISSSFGGPAETAGTGPRPSCSPSATNGPQISLQPLKPAPEPLIYQTERRLIKPGPQRSAIPHAAQSTMGFQWAGGPARSSLSSAPHAVCAHCFCPGGEAIGELWACGGACRRSFHSICHMPSGHSPQLLCSACLTDRHACGLSACPLTHFAGGNTRFRCAVHYCAACGMSGDSIPMTQCACCPLGFHARCKPKAAIVLTKKLIVCPRHA
ncbi:hypothetical protein WJX84_001250 [Apatococcus fuscideae]|uniref:Zinc finger PHD-type domain-containing protein n=1 Tax=Apatococcus fuscideae TaxID=2026836 RepID=A0AAW1SM98_9CHLO